MKHLIFQALAEAARMAEPVALGIITGVKGSSPQKLGAKAIFHAEGRIQGTLGGGCLEAEAQRLALRSLATGAPTLFELVLDHDFGWDDGLICGGKVSGVILPNAQNAGEPFWTELAKRETVLGWGVQPDFSITRATGKAGDPGPAAFTPADPNPPRKTRPPGDGPRSEDSPARNAALDLRGWLYHETVTPPCALWIAGSGHLAQAVAPLALQLDFAVTIFDDRPELANHRCFPDAVSLCTGHWGELCGAPFPVVPTYGLIVTRGHKHDALVLETWIHRPFAFLGMIGSARKARTIAEHFRQKEIATAEELARVACPVGVKIRSQSVMEIAVAILAQYIDQRAAGADEPRTTPTGKVELV